LGVSASCLEDTAETGRNYVNSGKYEFVDSCDELMLRFIMSMLIHKNGAVKGGVKDNMMNTLASMSIDVISTTTHSFKKTW